MTKAWSDQDILDLRVGLSESLSYSDIAEALGRSYKSVERKVQALGLTKANRSWLHLTKVEVLDLIRKFKHAEEFDNNPKLPGYKTCLRVLGVNTWIKAKELAGIDSYNTAKFDPDKETLFYVLQVTDIDGTIFFKYGITQRNLLLRYGNKPYKEISSIYISLSEARSMEQIYKRSKVPYIPKDRAFYKEGHGGYTECYVE